MDWSIVIAKILFVLVTIGFGVLSLVLIYHWQHFGKGKIKTWLFEIVYLLVGITLILAAMGVLRSL